MKKEKIYSICACLILIDQITKLIITLKMAVGKSITVIPGFFKIFYLRNTGAAFSLFEDMRFLFILVAIVLFLALYKYIEKNKISSKLEIVSLGLIMGGLVGNLVDRLLYGYVIDFLSFNIFGYNFPVFNIADIGIVSGVIILIVFSFREEFIKTKKKQRKKV